MVARGVRGADPWPRVLGQHDDERPGPLFIVVGGMHGNEPSGVVAARRVLAALEQRATKLNGRFVALCGNRGALARGERFLERDLNRLWTDVELRASLQRGADSAEGSELRELFQTIATLIAEARWRSVFLLDLHSTSAAGSPFSIMADTLQNRELALAFDVPVLLGLEERIEGTLLSWFSEQGHVAVCLEGGANDAPATVDHHEAALWIGLVRAGLLAAADAPQLAHKRALLERAARGQPAVVEVHYRHPIESDEDFCMHPGFENFDRVAAGEPLATSERGGGEQGLVRAPKAGLLLMPRYQGRGADGFFLGREVQPFWLWLSGLLRRMGLQGFPRYLPGVRALEGRKGVLLADPRIARFGLVPLFHLFGFRQARPRAGMRVFVRRPDGRHFG